MEKLKTNNNQKSKTIKTDEHGYYEITNHDVNTKLSSHGVLSELYIHSTNPIFNTIGLIKTFIPYSSINSHKLTFREIDFEDDIFSTSLLSSIEKYKKTINYLIKRNEIDVRLLLSYGDIFNIRENLVEILNTTQKPYGLNKKQKNNLIKLLGEEVIPALTTSTIEYSDLINKLFKDEINFFVFNVVFNSINVEEMLNKYAQCNEVKNNFFINNHFNISSFFNEDRNPIESILILHSQLKEFKTDFQIHFIKKEKLFELSEEHKQTLHNLFVRDFVVYLACYYQQMKKQFKFFHHSAIFFLLDVLEIHCHQDGQISKIVDSFLQNVFDKETNKIYQKTFKQHSKKWEKFNEYSLETKQDSLVKLKKFLDFLFSNSQNLFEEKELDINSMIYFEDNGTEHLDFVQAFIVFQHSIQHGLIENPFTTIDSLLNFNLKDWGERIVVSNKEMILFKKEELVDFVVNDLSTKIQNKNLVNGALKGLFYKKRVNYKNKKTINGIRKLKVNFPEFGNVVDFYLQQIELNPYHFKPLLLVGKTGREKLFLDSLLNVFKQYNETKSFLYNYETLPSDYFQTPAKHGESGGLLKLISSNNNSNFFISLYNLDKVNKNENNHLIELVDTNLNDNLFDFMNSIHFNASKINYVAIAEDLSKLSNSLTQFFEVFTPQPISKDDLKQYILDRWKDFSDSHSLKNNEVPNDILEQLVKHSFFEVDNILNRLFGLMLSNEEISLPTVLEITKQYKNISLSSGNHHFSIIEPSDIEVDFDDIKGCEEAKKQLNELVELFLTNEQLPIPKPKGFIMYGASGVGKTMLAKAFAKKSNMPFLSLSGSSFVEKYVGVGAKRVRELFQTAQQNAPCIIYIDELDALGSRNEGGNNSERESTINEFLIQLDGIKKSEDILVIGSTNFLDKLDKALIRAGRFDRKIELKLPTKQERFEIIQHLNSTKYKTSLTEEDLHVVAKMTYGSSPAEIVNLFQQAFIIAFRNKKEVDINHFREAMEEIELGIKTVSLNDKDKRATAYHEVGHAVLGHLLPNAHPVRQVTVVPRSNALGVTYSYPEEDNYHVTKEHLLDDICMKLGGRAAEELFIHSISAGASGDIRQVTKIANNMILKYGFAEDQYLSMVLYEDLTQLSDLTKNKIEQEVLNIIKTQYERAKELLLENEKFVHKLTELLIDREVIYEEDIIECQNSLQ